MVSEQHGHLPKLSITAGIAHTLSGMPGIPPMTLQTNTTDVEMSPSSAGHSPQSAPGNLDSVALGQHALQLVDSETGNKKRGWRERKKAGLKIKVEP